MVSPGLAAVDVLHRRSQGDRVTADVALHALRFACRAGGIQDIGRFVRLEPLYRHICAAVCRARSVA